MFVFARHLFFPKGVVKSIQRKYAFLEFKDGTEVKAAFLLPSNATPSLVGRDVAFEMAPSARAAGKTEAWGLRLCEASEATGTIRFYDPIAGFGFVTDKDGKESLVHHSKVVDLGPCPTKLKSRDPVEFDVQPGEKGLVASNVRRI